MRANFESRATFGAGAILSTLTCAAARKQINKQGAQPLYRPQRDMHRRSARSAQHSSAHLNTAQLISTQHSSTQPAIKPQ
jgi:hypothetical protein